MLPREPMPIPDMKPDELEACCASIGWTQGDLVNATGCLRENVRRWFYDRSRGSAKRVPTGIAATLRKLAQFHDDNPFPPPP